MGLPGLIIGTYQRQHFITHSSNIPCGSKTIYWVYHSAAPDITLKQSMVCKKNLNALLFDILIKWKKTLYWFNIRTDICFSFLLCQEWPGHLTKEYRSCPTMFLSDDTIRQPDFKITIQSWVPLGCQRLSDRLPSADSTLLIRSFSHFVVLLSDQVKKLVSIIYWVQGPKYEISISMLSLEWMEEGKAS